jgi:hypothetical protein
MGASATPRSADGYAPGGFVPDAVGAKFGLLGYLVLDTTDEGALRLQFHSVGVAGKDAFDAVFGFVGACFDGGRGAISIPCSYLVEEADDLAGGVLSQYEYRDAFVFGGLK